jgi:hypothetical protein
MTVPGAGAARSVNIFEPRGIGGHKVQRAAGKAVTKESRAVRYAIARLFPVTGGGAGSLAGFRLLPPVEPEIRQRSVCPSAPRQGAQARFLARDHWIGVSCLLSSADKLLSVTTRNVLTG